MIRIQLPVAEAQRLDTLFRSTDDRKLRDRLQIVRMVPDLYARFCGNAEPGEPQRLPK